MLRLIENFYTQLRSILNEQSQREINQLSNELSQEDDLAIAECKDILRAYVIEPTRPNLPKAAKGYLKPSQIKTTEQIQALKLEVLSQFDTLHNAGQASLTESQKTVLNHCINDIKTKLANPNSEANRFLSHRKTQFIGDQSASRMASFLLAYFLLEKIDSLDSVQKTHDIVAALEKASAFGKGDLSNRFIKPVTSLLDRAIAHSQAQNKQIAAKIHEDMQLMIDIAIKAFENEIIAKAISYKSTFKHVAIASSELAESYERYERECQNYEQLFDTIQQLEEEIRRLNEQHRTSLLVLDSFDAALSLDQANPKKWPQPFAEEFKEWLKKPDQLAKDYSIEHIHVAHIDFHNKKRPELLQASQDIERAIQQKQAEKKTTIQSLKQSEIDKESILTELKAQASQTREPFKSNFQYLAELTDGSIKLSNSLKVIQAVNVYSNAQQQEILKAAIQQCQEQLPQGVTLQPVIVNYRITGIDIRLEEPEAQEMRTGGHAEASSGAAALAFAGTSQQAQAATAAQPL
jgi:hypothetical protein